MYNGKGVLAFRMLLMQLYLKNKLYMCRCDLEFLLQTKQKHADGRNSAMWLANSILMMKFSSLRKNPSLISIQLCF